MTTEPHEATSPAESANPGLLMRVAALALETLDRRAASAGFDSPPPAEARLRDIATWLSSLSSVACRVVTVPRSALAEGLGPGMVRVLPTDGGFLVQGARKSALLTPSREQALPSRGPRLVRLFSREQLLCIEVEPRLGLESLSNRAMGSASPWQRLRALLRLERPDLYALLAYAVVLGGLSLAVPVAVQVMVNTIAFGQLLQPLLVLSLILLAVLSFNGMLSVIEAYAVEVLQRRLFVRVAEDFSRRLPLVTRQAHADNDVHELTNRFFDVITLQKSSSVLLLSALSLLLQTLVGLALLAFYHPLLLAFDAVLLLALAGVVATGYGAVPTATDESTAKFQVAAFLQSISERPHLFARAPGTQFASVKGSALTHSYLQARRAHYRILLRQLVGGVAIQVFAISSLLGLGGLLVLRGELTLGQLVAAELVVGMIGAGVAKLGKHFESAYDLLASLDKLGRVIDLPVSPPRVTAAGGQAVGLSVPANFSVSGASSRRELPAGARCHMLGPDTDTSRMLFDACRGALPLDEVQALHKGSRQPVTQYAFVGRSEDVVAGTVLDNLRVVDPALSEARAREVLIDVGLEDFLSSHDDPLRFRIRAGGAPLTRAERARLSLARALLGQRGILVLDGVLDEVGLDSRRLRVLLDRIFDEQAPWTLLVRSDVPAVIERCTTTLAMPASETP